MDYVQIKKLYRERVEEWAQHNDQWLASKGWPFSDHAKDIATKILMTRDKIENYPGDFIQAVMDNKLRESISRADPDVRQCLYPIMFCYWNVDTWDIARQYTPQEVSI